MLELLTSWLWLNKSSSRSYVFSFVSLTNVSPFSLCLTSAIKDFLSDPSWYMVIGVIGVSSSST